MHKELLLRSWHQEEVVDLDEVLAPSSAASDEADVETVYCAPCDGVDAPLTNCALKNGAATVIGLLLSERIENPAYAAMKFLTTSYENDFTPIVISLFPNSGFEQLGFRVEYALNADPAARNALIEQIKTFWGVEFLVDISATMAES